MVKQPLTIVIWDIVVMTLHMIALEVLTGGIIVQI